MSSLWRSFRSYLSIGFFAWAAAAPAQITNFSLVGIDANQRPRLRITGAAGTNYTVEQSANLADWIAVYSGVATNGTLDYLDAAVNGRAAFYRARIASAPLRVQPKFDTNRFGVGLVTSSGGYCEVRATNGTRFKLTVPSNSVPESVVVKMTVITNLAGVPGSGLFPAAVQLEPDGLQFVGAATLEIEFPTNVPVNEIASYAFSQTGADFYLTPDQAETNQVRIPVIHFSSAGTTRVNKQELANLVTLSIANARNQMNQTVASKIDVARQNGTATLETVENAFKAEARKLLQDQILPNLEEAKHNCALFKQMMPQIFGLDREAQLLGAGSIPELATAEAMWCDGIVNCEDEIIRQCQQEGGNTALLSELIDTERARQLMGENSCPPTSDLNSRLSNCIPQWYGTLTYSASGFTNDTSDPHCLQTSSSEYRFRGIVTNATEEDLVMYKLVTLYIQGDADGQRVIERTCNNEGYCAPADAAGTWSDYYHMRETQAVAGKETAKVMWYQYPNGSALIFAIEFGNEPLFSGSLAQQTRSNNCDASKESSDTTSSVIDTLFANGYSDMTGGGVTSSSASGTATDQVPEPQGATITVNWTWNFRRK